MQYKAKALVMAVSLVACVTLLFIVRALLEQRNPYVLFKLSGVTNRASGTVEAEFLVEPKGDVVVYQVYDVGGDERIVGELGFIGGNTTLQRVLSPSTSHCRFDLPAGASTALSQGESFRVLAGERRVVAEWTQADPVSGVESIGQAILAVERAGP